MVIQFFSCLGLWIVGFFTPTALSAQPQGDYKTVETMVVQPSKISHSARLMGQIQAKKSTLFTAQSGGILIHKAIPGTSLQPGDLVAQLDNADLQQTLVLAQQSERVAKDQYDRVSTLVKTKTASQQDADSRLNAWNEAQKQLASAKIALEKTQFLAPYAGTVGVYLKREGTQVQGGDPIVVFYDPSHLVVEFDIPADYLKTLKEGQPVMIKGRSFPLKTIQRFVDPETHMSPASVDYEEENCTIGTIVPLDLILAQKENVIVIPTEAVFLRQGQPFVYTISGEGTATLTPVKTGIRQEDRVEIQEGLKQGDRIVVKNPSRLYPGVAVRDHPQEGPTDNPVNQATLHP